MPPGSGRGPIGGLVGLIGSGVGAAAEYREHRKEQKLSRENSRQEREAVAGPSTTPQHAQQAPLATSSDAPPSYAELDAGPVDRSPARGPPASDDKKTALYDEVSSDDESESDFESLEDDEEDWELDEALEKSDSRDLPSYEESENDFRTTDELVQDVLLTSRAATEQPRVRRPLTCPVILPQRRPRKKTRGFVRAYAPVLADSGIDQDTFLSFLKNFHKSSQASPIFTVIQVSAGIAGMAPSVIAMAVTTVVQVAAGVGQEVQARQRTNNFLLEMNEKLFKPAGLYAFIVKYKPDADLNQASSKTDIGARFGLRPQVVDMSTNQVIAKYYRSTSSEDNVGGGGGNRSMSERLKDIRLASGTTQGTAQLPEAAPLIFPAIDNAVARDGAEETFKDKARDAKKFLGDYLDRRAHMQYARDDPASNLAVPEEQRAFRSKLADSSHPAFQGGVVGLVTGGAVGSPRAEKRERRSERRFERDERRALKDEQRMDQGKRLSGKKQSRYEAFTSEAERRGGGIGGGRLEARRGYGDDDDNDYDDQQGHGRRRSRSSGRRGGLISGLVGAAVSAASKHNNSSEPAPAAPYGGQSSVSDSAAPHIKSGSRSREYEDLPTNDTTQYGGPPASAPAGLYDGGRRQRRSQRGGRGGGPVGMVKRMMREDVLYLMIVNMPSEAELAKAREQLARFKNT
ncbi:hypothetical protein LTR85_002830 [Meristemomyces frigidus]|nr:hypothetical protein LTR85_002830 [Meristemomyces frigidus]